MKSLVALLIAALVVSTRAQIPSLGFCPEYLPMAGFDMERFAGIWYEAERYFQLTEVASRCVTSNYTKGPDGKFYVTNEVMSRFTGIKRVLEGEIRKPATKAEEGKLHVKYTTVPFIPLETQYNVLDTDYDQYAVLWSCSGVGPVHTQNAWIMTRKRVAPGEILQKAYGVLDKYKISKIFFVKTNQDDCAYLDSLHSDLTEAPQKAPQASDEEYEEEQPQPLTKSVPETRAHIVPDMIDAVSEIGKVEEKVVVLKEPVVEEPVRAEPAVKSVPELILEKAREPVAEPVKELVKEAVKEEVASVPELPKEAAPVIVEEPAKPVEVVQETIEVVKP